MIKLKHNLLLSFYFVTFIVTNAQIDPDTAEVVSVDRFSEQAATLMVRDAMNGLPEANEPINFDSGEPFITKGLGPNGEHVSYYNFDVQPLEPAPIYVLFKEGEDTPVAGQLNIIDVIPGDEGYNDFWEVQKVTVPADYTANTLTSASELSATGYPMEETEILVNCPVVPQGSTAELRLNDEDPGLTRGWYKNMVVYYFNFSEKALMVNSADLVPTSPIYVTFNINPDQPGGGPPSGFVTEEATGRAHNVIATLPADEGYSPLWSVDVYHNEDFPNVYNLESAEMSNVLATGVANVNCPVVMIEAGVNPDTTEVVGVDRFSEEAATLMVRDAMNGLPEANEPINFDSGEPFITKGLGPNGEHVSYYNFDVQPLEPAPIYVLFKEGADSPVPGQLNIINVIPGDEGYNDFWEVQKVTVPSDYTANTITSADELSTAGYAMEETEILVNCPVVPQGSTAMLRLTEEDPGLTRGWYKGMVVYYFNFSEKALMVNSADQVSTSPIYVTFNINPDQPGGGPPSGFVTEEATGRAHNVIATLPADEGYSPLWSVNVYHNEDFDSVSNLTTAEMANILATGVANVNCPVVMVETPTSVKEENINGKPDKFEISQNYPNPFNPSTTIKFAVPENEFVSVKIYNNLGQEVTRLVNEDLTAGNYSVIWNADNLTSGIYYYSIQAGNFIETRKMILLK